jgi:hypothetical protein
MVTFVIREKHAFQQKLSTVEKFLEMGNEQYECHCIETCPEESYY